MDLNKPPSSAISMTSIPPDVIQNILSQLSPSNEDITTLRSCTLVSSTFLYFSRTLLFKIIDLPIHRIHTLIELIQRNPSIASFIQNLTIQLKRDTSVTSASECETETLYDSIPHILSLLRTTLRKLALFDVQAGVVLNHDPPFDETNLCTILTSSIRDLLRERILEILYLNGFHSNSVCWLQEMLPVFDGRRGTLKVLKLPDVRILRDTISTSIQPLSEPQKLEVLTLDPLTSRECFFSWILHPRCSIDISMLRELQLLNVSNISYVVNLWKKANLGKSVEKLVLQIRVISFAYDTLAPFTSVRTLELTLTLYDIRSYISYLVYLLSTVTPQNNLETIRLWRMGARRFFIIPNFSTSYSADKMRKDWQPVDELLCEKKFACLKNVEFIAQPYANQGGTSSTEGKVLIGAEKFVMPLLSEKGLVQVMLY